MCRLYRMYQLYQQIKNIPSVIGYRPAGCGGAKGGRWSVSGRVMAGDGRALTVIERRPDTLT